MNTRPEHSGARRQSQKRRRAILRAGALAGGLAACALALAADEPAGGVGIPAAPAGAPAPAVAAAPALAPARQYALAHESLARAEWMKQQGLAEEAGELYAEAKTLFQQLAADHPLWETNVVAFRIRYCADALARLPPPETAAEPPAPGPAAPPAAAERPLPPAARSAPLTAADIARFTAHLREGLRLERAGDLQGALEQYLSVVDQQPRNPEALKGAGRCCLKAGLPEDARDLLEKAMRLPDPDAELNLLMALVYCRDQEFGKAYQLLVIALDAQPSNPLAHLVMGVALAGLNRLDEARVETQKAIQLDAQQGDAYYNLARLSLKLKPASPGVAHGHYLNALRYGAEPDPEFAKRLP